jgi:predicted transcriptional regulator
MNAVLEISPDVKAKLHHLAQKTHRTETELANEALTAFIEHDSYIRAKIPNGLEQAARREFVSDTEMEQFFAEHSDKAA